MKNGENTIRNGNEIKHANEEDGSHEQRHHELFPSSAWQELPLKKADWNMQIKTLDMSAFLRQALDMSAFFSDKH